MGYRSIPLSHLREETNTQTPSHLSIPTPSPQGSRCGEMDNLTKITLKGYPAMGYRSIPLSHLREVTNTQTASHLSIPTPSPQGSRCGGEMDNLTKITLKGYPAMDYTSIPLSHLRGVTNTQIHLMLQNPNRTRLDLVVLLEC